MNTLNMENIHPFIRKVGVVHGFRYKNFVLSRDYRLLLFCYDGGIVETKTKTHKISALDLCLISPGVPYKIALTPEQKAIVINFDWTHENPENYGVVLSQPEARYTNDDIIYRPDIRALFPDNDFNLIRASNALLKSAHKMVEIFFHPTEVQPIKSLKLTGIFTEMLAEILSAGDTKNEKAERIYQYICNHYDKALTLEDVAAHFHYHPTYINRLLNARYHMSFKKIIVDARLNEAVTLLDDSSLSVAEIANLLGFYDYKHFQQSFKSKYGITPSKFRK